MMTKSQKTVFPESKVAKFIFDRIPLVDKSQKEIAFELGYSKPNVVSMMKTGIMKVPVEKVSQLAKTLEVDEVRLLRMVMEEYMPETWSAIQNIIGHAITQNESEMIGIIRKETGDTDPKMRTAEQKKLLKQFANSLK